MQIDMPKVSLAIGVAVMLETAIGGGTLSLTNAVSPHLIPVVQAWCNLLAFLGATILTALHAYSGPSTGVLASPPTVAQAQQVMAAAKTTAAVLLLALLLWPVDARAQVNLQNGPIHQTIKKIEGQVANPGGGGFLPGEKRVDNAPCDFNVFTALEAKNLLDQLKICIGAQAVEDVTAALASATAVNDGVGVNCLTPGLAMIKAAGDAANSSASVAPAPAPAPPPDPSVAAPPATSLPPVRNPKIILLFQKFREWGLAGGPAACKSWVLSTIKLTDPLTQ
jgi:hypothetical protein